jgi:hypothetical protein
MGWLRAEDALVPDRFADSAEAAGAFRRCASPRRSLSLVLADAESGELRGGSPPSPSGTPIDRELERLFEQLRYEKAVVRTETSISVIPVARDRIDLMYEGEVVAELRWTDSGDADEVGWSLLLRFPSGEPGGNELEIEMREHVEPQPLHALRLICRARPWADSDPDLLATMLRSARDTTRGDASRWARRELAAIIYDHWRLDDEPLPLPRRAWADDRPDRS